MPKLRWLNTVLVLVTGVDLLGGLLNAVQIAKEGVLLLAPNGYENAATEEIRMTAGDEQAMEWLFENTPSGTLFATNRYHTGSPLAGNSNLYTAFSGRQAYMEGFRYTISNMGVSQQVVDERFTNNAILFSPKSDIQTILALAQQEGIDYLVFSAQLGQRPDAFDQLECCYKNESVQIYRLPE